MTQSMQGFGANLSILRAQFGNDLAVDLQYRASTAIWMIGAILDPVIYLIVWSTVAVAQGGSVDGMTPSDFAAYFMLTFFVGEFTYSWTVWELQNYVREGDFAAHLVRPVHPLLAYLSKNLASKTLRMAIIIPAVLIMALLFKPALHFTLWSALAFIPALLLASALYFVLDFTMALAAFWVTRMSAIARLHDTAFMLLSGYFAPLALFPPAILALTWLLPYRWMMAFPVELLTSPPDPAGIAIGIAAQIIWLAILVFLLGAIYTRAVKRFAAVGG